MTDAPLETRVLVVVTGHEAIDDETPTGVWLEEFARPYRAFVDQGYGVDVASPEGGLAPIDPRSEEAAEEEWAEARARLRDTLRLTDVSADPYDALFLPGGHGTMFDFPGDPDLGRLVAEFAASDRVIAAVCHGPAGFVGVTDGDGEPVVAGMRMTAFTDAEEAETGLEDRMPFLLESRLRELGADFETRDPWSDHVVVDGTWVTGQNPQSSAGVAEEIVLAIQERKSVETGIS